MRSPTATKSLAHRRRGLLRQGLRPRNGKLILSFANIDAYHSFDPATPFKSRMIDEDFNRTWGQSRPAADHGRDQTRAGAKPFVEQADLLLDLHSMHDDGVPLMLSVTRQGRPLAKLWARRSTSSVWIPATLPACACATMAGFGDPKSPKNAF